MNTSNTTSAKEDAIRIINGLPEQATLDDIMYELYVKQKINRGLAAAAKGQVLSQEEAKKRLLGKHEG